MFSVNIDHMKRKTALGLPRSFYKVKSIDTPIGKAKKYTANLSRYPASSKQKQHWKAMAACGRYRTGMPALPPTESSEYYSNCLAFHKARPSRLSESMKTRRRQFVKRTFA